MQIEVFISEMGKFIPIFQTQTKHKYKKDYEKDISYIAGFNCLLFNPEIASLSSFIGRKY